MGGFVALLIPRGEVSDFFRGNPEQTGKDLESADKTAACLAFLPVLLQKQLFFAKQAKTNPVRRLGTLHGDLWGLEPQNLLRFVLLLFIPTFLVLKNQKSRKK